MEKENYPPNPKRNHVVSQIKQSVVRQPVSTKTGKLHSAKPENPRVNIVIAASTIQRCWRKCMARRTRLQTNAIRALLEQRQLLLKSIDSKSQTNRSLSNEVYRRSVDPQYSLQLELEKERHRFQEIIQRGVRHLLHQQSDIIDRQQQIQLYKQLTREQAKQHEQLLQQLEQQEQATRQLDGRLEQRLSEITSLSQQLKHEHLEKSRLAYQKEYLLAEHTRLKRLQPSNTTSESTVAGYKQSSLA